MCLKQHRLVVCVVTFCYWNPLPSLSWLILVNWLSARAKKWIKLCDNHVCSIYECLSGFIAFRVMKMSHLSQYNNKVLVPFPQSVNFPHKLILQRSMLFLRTKHPYINLNLLKISCYLTQPTFNFLLLPRQLLQLTIQLLDLAFHTFLEVLHWTVLQHRWL